MVFKSVPLPSGRECKVQVTEETVCVCVYACERVRERESHGRIMF